VLKIENLHKSFGKHEVLKGVDLSVETGNVIVILGPSGSGKTTLLRCINFLEKADSGRLSFKELDLDIPRASSNEISDIRKRTAFVFQNYNLFRNKTALENVTEGLIVARRVKKSLASEIARRALDKVGLSGKYDFYPHQLSGGLAAEGRDCTSNCGKSRCHSF